MDNDRHIKQRPLTWLLIACWLTYSMGALWWLESEARPDGLPICTTTK